jgi:hypothetical protein
MVQANQKKRAWRDSNPQPSDLNFFLALFASVLVFASVWIILLKVSNLSDETI